MFEKEAEMEFQKLPLKEREKLVSVVQAWNKAFVSGANFGFQKCAKSRLNITTISDRPAEGIIAELQADVEARKFAMAMSEKVEKQLREENADLKNRNQELLKSCEGATMLCKDFQRAKEIIEGLMRFCRCFAQHHTEDIRYKDAVQFLSEVEND